MFANLGHFSYAAIQIAYTFLVYPALILGNMGQAAYLSRNHQYHNFGYSFLRRSCRSPDVVLKIPPASLLEVGMVYVL
ncbi:hypothetical protein QVD17_35811 [Tagetes erecta]|uniref:K+ potassium transporter integral membrane domain-containing protein n=1 Tax=Tagetes erecta TaxID=13708 RepID=A0AAD8JXB9_TARER|nr:hypothetical protein QVD17_35811 [Tagetes erecta]